MITNITPVIRRISKGRIPEFLVEEYRVDLTKLGYSVRKADGKVFTFTGKLFANSRVEAYSKLGIVPKIKYPTRFFVVDTIEEAESLKDAHLDAIGLSFENELDIALIGIDLKDID